MFCTRCQDKGIILRGNQAIICDCRRKKKQADLLAQSGLPPIMQDYCFKKFNYSFYSKTEIDEESGYTYQRAAQIAYQAAWEFAKQCLKEPQRAEGLLITGGVGSGKTFLSGCIANYLLHNNCPVKFVVVPDLLDDMRSSYASRETSEQDIVEQIKKSRVLILDDLGVHNYTEWVKNKLYSLINYRLNYQLPTVVTSNSELKELENYLESRITSRLAQLCKPCRLNAVDIRVVQKYQAKNQ